MHKSTKRRLGGEEYVKITSARQEFNSFQELEESQYDWTLDGRIRRVKRCCNQGYLGIQYFL